MHLFSVQCDILFGQDHPQSHSESSQSFGRTHVSSYSTPVMRLWRVWRSIPGVSYVVESFQPEEGVDLKWGFRWACPNSMPYWSPYRRHSAATIDIKIWLRYSRESTADVSRPQCVNFSLQIRFSLFCQPSSHPVTMAPPAAEIATCVMIPSPSDCYPSFKSWRWRFLTKI